MSTPPSGKRSLFVVAGRYHIQRQLGEGSLGTAYLARDDAGGRLVTLKLIRAARLSPERLAELQEEFRAFASLEHPQIACAYDFGYTDDGKVPFYTREFIEGAPLAAGPPPAAPAASPGDFLSPLLDLLEALDYLHAHELLHLDVHPGNIIVARERGRGGVLIDFGLGRLLLHGLGSSAFLRLREALAPEMLSGEGVGPAADIHAAGRLLLYRLTGRLEGEPRLPREIAGWGARLTLELERIAAKALQERPERRFRSAAEFRAALSAALGKAAGPARVVEPRGALVGRGAELEAVEDALRRVDGGKAVVLWLTGGPGLGKTRLLAEARVRAQLRGLEVAEARFFEEPGREPPLLRVLRAAARGRRRGAEWLRPLAPEHGGTSRERARRAAGAYFHEDGVAPLVVLLDDLECAERESRLLAEALLAESARRGREDSAGRGIALIVASSQQPPPGLALSERRGSRRRLRPLGGRDARALLAGLLRPLEAPPAVLARVAGLCRGSPAALRRAARALRAEFGAGGGIPPGAAVPYTLLAGEGPLALPRAGDALGLEAALALAAIARPATLEEVAAASALEPQALRPVLRRLVREEIVVALRERGGRRYALARDDAAARLLEGLTAGAGRRAHARLAAHLRSRPERDAATLENLARHLLAAGRRGEGRAAALAAVTALRRRGLLQNALRLLEQAASAETVPAWRLRFAEEMSALHEVAGDHEEGIAVLSPFLRKALDRRAAVRVRRRLGVHCHRSGLPARALALFEEARRRAEPARDLEELVFVESELAELHTFRGEYEAAEASCRRGLDLLRGLAPGERTPGGEGAPGAEGDRESGAGFPDRMRLLLRASLGHLELRRMALPRARRELEAAARLARRAGTTALRAFIWNNLGIAYNQLGRLSAAERCYRRAEKLLLHSGELGGVIYTASNLAAIAAKRGEAGRAREHLERAAALLARHPGKRLQFAFDLTRGMVAHSLGDAPAAAAAFAAAIPLGRGLGDVQFVGFGDLYLAEALIACGQYGEAGVRLRRAAAAVERAGPPVLARMVHSRLYLLEALVGRERAARRWRERLDAASRTDLRLLEAWNELAAAFAGALLRRAGAGPKSDAGAGQDGAWAAAAGAFAALEVPAGRRLAAVGRLYGAVAGGDRERLRGAVDDVAAAAAGAAAGSHRLLSVLEPLALAEAAFALGELERAEGCLEEASSAIVGLSLPELDWRLELLYALVAERRGDREGARRRLHRSLHGRDLLARSLPARRRAAFLEQPRFAPLAEVARRLERPRLALGAGTPRPGDGFQGMVGTSPAMRAVFETVERLGDQEIPVLITGETGTGKELVARALHRTSPRREGPFFALHCASLPAELFEAELFGYERGAFTGADEARPGLLEHLAGGTLFLDEAAQLALESQAKLLRLLDAGLYRPVGAVSLRRADVRFLASASADLEEAAERGAFRRDLIFRLRGVEIHLPPLRERREDVPVLARHFLAAAARRLERTPPVLTSSALALLAGQPWPGNARELAALLTRMLVTASPHARIDAEAVRPFLARAERRSVINEEAVAGRSLEELQAEVERVFLTRLFRETGGDLQKMMETLRVGRATLYRRLRRAGVDIDALRRGR